MLLETQVEISCAHFVQTADESSPCRRLHGHNFLIKVFVSSNEIPESGMIVDFRDIKNMIKKMDHKFILPKKLILYLDEHQNSWIQNNEKIYSIPIEDCYEFPFNVVTAENIALHIFDILSENNHYKWRIKVSENVNNIAKVGDF